MDSKFRVNSWPVMSSSITLTFSCTFSLYNRHKTKFISVVFSILNPIGKGVLQEGFKHGSCSMRKSEKCYKSEKVKSLVLMMKPTNSFHSNKLSYSQGYHKDNWTQQ